MRRMWTCLFFLISPTLVFADTPQQGDLSMKYLGQIFGDVPGALHGAGTGLISGLFGVFNEGVMTVATVWLLYTIVQVLMSTATSDGPQKSLKNWFLWFRVAMGFAMLVPTPSGYCIAQELMMQAVVQGVALANKTWDYTLDYMRQGGAIFKVTSTSPVSDITKLDSIIGVSGGNDNQPSSNALLTQVFQNEVCMNLSSIYNKRINAENEATGTQQAVVPTNFRVIGVPPQFASNALKPNTGMIFFPGGSDTQTTYNGMGTPPQGCGSLNMKLNASNNNSIVSVPMMTRQNYAAVMQVVLDLEPLARQIAENVSSTTTPPAVPAPSAVMGGPILFNATLDYLHLIQPMADELAQNSANGNDNFVDDAEKQGWFNAGGFYWNLVRWNNSVGTQHGDPTKYPPIVTAHQSGLPTSVVNWMSNAGTVLSNGMWGNARGQVSKYLSGSSSEDPRYESVNSAIRLGFDMGTITGPLTQMVNVINKEMADGNMDAYNPMITSYHIGKQALKSAGLMWTIMITVITPISVALGICDSANPGNVIFRGITSWLTPMVVASSGFLFATGALLTFYVPLYPYLLFLFGVVGWILYVVEAMVAAPLVAFGMSHPEGHDFMGRAEQALMLTLGVFLRPALMVIGYVIGVMLVYIVSGFLNTVLGQVFESTYAGHYKALGAGVDGFDGVWGSFTGSAHNSVYGHFTGSFFADALCVPILLTMYSTLMVEVTNQCFGAIHQVPDMVLRWIGGPVQQSDAAQRAQAIKGAVQSTGQEMGKFGGGMVNAQSQGMNSTVKPLNKAWGKNSGQPEGDDKGSGNTEGDSVGGAGEDAGAGGGVSGSGAEGAAMAL